MPGPVGKSPWTPQCGHREARALSESTRGPRLSCRSPSATELRCSVGDGQSPTSCEEHQDHSTIRALSTLLSLGKRGMHLMYSEAIHYLGKLFLKNRKNYVETDAADPRPCNVMTGTGLHLRGQRCSVIARLWSPGQTCTRPTK